MKIERMHGILIKIETSMAKDLWKELYSLNKLNIDWGSQPLLRRLTDGLSNELHIDLQDLD